MNILILSPYSERLLPFLKNHTVESTEDKVRNDYITSFDFVISYGYRYILSKEIIDAMPRKIINLHTSYLPFNRGADPNFWANYEGTPSGVTIHYMDEGIDTGDIIVSQKAYFFSDATLASSYDVLQNMIVGLFMMYIDVILCGDVRGVPQKKGGTYHNSKDKEEIFSEIKTRYPTIYDCPLKELRKK